ncbi:hypothetical protein Cob_v010290 [Colletotrichum orbiculare MAFF 240422]|uniref:Uncharacterized protein n=1 Tax=Colletotrichum orbiculare (strain 104-T / ATCC 96160 / CBS 514.97 / LARS 414 / MAFF 240422) TaxID=1213857 RepID=N4VLD4_COLOR|nr:hypothetical protein Cob_v010290 [Colletotrichum orbiculare MAFF 240422]
MAENELPVAAAALAIAILALFVASLQILQAVFATARGLPNCDERVIGDWARYTKRRPKITQLRLEVQFEAPIIFLAPQTNTNNPMKKEAWQAKGTKESCEQIRIKWKDVVAHAQEEEDDPQSEPRSHGFGSSLKRARPDEEKPPESRALQRKGRKSKEPIHTVDNEQATWVWLLVAVQRMEAESKQWEQEHRGPDAPGFADPTLTVKIQAKRRSFDMNPAIKKPYATTTISHLAELAAVLGLYWKAFDRDGNQYRAEGNGYSLTGSRVADFGIVFVFEKTGRTVFEEKRIIPTSEVKELCFGRVPTLYRGRENREEDLDWQNPLMTSSGEGDLRVEILQLGSRDEIAETLTQIGCNVNTTLYVKEENKYSHAHLFSVTFEVIGMLARTLHIKDRSFRFLPNPTISRWDRDSLSLLRLMSEFTDLLESNHTDIKRFSKRYGDKIQAEMSKIGNILEEATRLKRELKPGRKFAYKDLNKLHEAIDWADEVLQAKEQTLVLDVIRCHLQEVLAAINHPSSAAGGAGNPTGSDAPSFGDLLETPPEKREHSFMNIYFHKILHRVVATNSSNQGGKDQEQVSREIYKDNEIKILSRRGTGMGSPADEAAAGEQSTSPGTSPTDAGPGLINKQRWPETESVRGTTKPTLESFVREHFQMQRLTIWYTLVFRMICWLTLHDFDKRDVQLPKSELMGNRQPVFIT